MRCKSAYGGGKRKTDGTRGQEQAEDPAREERRCAADCGAQWTAWVSGNRGPDARAIARNQTRLAACCACGGNGKGWSHRLVACEQGAAAGSGDTRRSERARRGRRAAKRRSGCAVARSRGRVGAKARLQEHVRAIERDSRACAQVLRTKRLRALQDAEVLSQTALNLARIPRNCFQNRVWHEARTIYRITIYLPNGEGDHFRGVPGARGAAIPHS